MKEQKIWELIDTLVASANSATDQGLEPGEASQALLYAAARYSAFVVAASSESKEDFCQDRVQAQRFYLDQFRRLLLENFDEYEDNFNEYTGE